MLKSIVTIIAAFLLMQMAIASPAGNGVPYLEIKQDTLPPKSGDNEFTAAFSWIPDDWWKEIYVPSEEDDSLRHEPIGPTSRLPAGRCGSYFEELIISQLTWGPAVFDATYDEKGELPIRNGVLYVDESGYTTVKVKMPAGVGWEFQSNLGPVQQECFPYEPMPWEEGYNWLELSPEQVDTTGWQIGEAVYEERKDPRTIEGYISVSAYNIAEDLTYQFSDLSLGIGSTKGPWTWWIEAILGRFATRPEQFNRKEAGYYWGVRLNTSFELTPNFLQKHSVVSGSFIALSAADVFNRTANTAMDLGPNQKPMGRVVTGELGIFLRWQRFQFQYFVALWPQDQGSYELNTRGTFGEDAPTGDEKTGGWGLGLRIGYHFW